MSNELLAKTNEILSKYTLADRHSYFQLKNYIIGKEHTLHGKMWQCIRELKTRYESIESIKLQIEEINDKLDLLDIKKEIYLTQIKDNSYEVNIAKLKEKEVKIKIKQLARQKTRIEKNGIELAEKMKYIQEEMNYFIHAFEQLRKMGDWKEYDDPKAQELYWNEKLEYELNMRLILGQPVDTELGKTIDALDNNAPVKKKLTSIITEYQNLISTSKEDK